MEPRVVVSMTTIPERNGSLGPTLLSLVEQTRKPNVIAMYLPPGADVPVLPECKDVQIVKVRAGIDLGPIMKLSAVLDSEPDTLVVTVDDDIIYDRNWLRTIVDAAMNYPDDALGFSGWSARSLVEDDQWVFRSPNGYCDVLEGWAGAAYWPRFFKPGVMKIPDSFKFVDDVWISSYLYHQRIHRRVIEQPMAKWQRLHQGIHDRPGFKQLNRVAARIGFNL